MAFGSAGSVIAAIEHTFSFLPADRWLCTADPCNENGFAGPTSSQDMRQSHRGLHNVQIFPYRTAGNMVARQRCLARVLLANRTGVRTRSFVQFF